MKKTLKRFSFAEANVAPDDFLRKYQLKGIIGGIISGGYCYVCATTTEGCEDYYTIGTCPDKDEKGTCGSNEECWDYLDGHCPGGFGFWPC